MLPKTLALVDDDAEFCEFLSQYLKGQDVEVRHFTSSSDFLADHDAFDFEFYVLDLGLPGVDGLELIRILRRRTSVGILVVSGRLAPDVFDSVIIAGADMYLAKPVRFEQVALAVRAVHRRIAPSSEAAPMWRLDRRASELIAPDGTRVDLSETDLAVMECFLDAAGGTVSREILKARLRRPPAEESDNVLHATIYRLRKRIERATPVMVPLQSQSRVGYVFRAALALA